MTFDSSVREAGAYLAEAFAPPEPYAAVFTGAGVRVLRVDDHERATVMSHWEDVVAYRVTRDGADLRGGRVAGYELAGPEQVDEWFSDGGRLTA